MCRCLPNALYAGDPCGSTYKWLTVQMTCTYCDPNSVTTGADQWSNLRQSGWSMSADWTCAPGYYLGSAVPVTKSCDMDVGSFGNAGIGCNACGTGYYCPGGSANSRTACPAGTYGRPLDVTLSSASCSGQCQAGFFCPTGSTTPVTQSWCVASLLCTAASQYRAARHVFNADIYNAPTGEARRLPCLLCICSGDISLYCPAGTTARLTVPDGFYSGPLGVNPNQRYQALTW
jgi:hypothetical protein